MQAEADLAHLCSAICYAKSSLLLYPCAYVHALRRDWHPMANVEASGVPPKTLPQDRYLSCELDLLLKRLAKKTPSWLPSPKL